MRVYVTHVQRVGVCMVGDMESPAQLCEFGIYTDVDPKSITNRDKRSRWAAEVGAAILAAVLVHDGVTLTDADRAAADKNDDENAMRAKKRAAMAAKWADEIAATTAPRELL